METSLAEPMLTVPVRVRKNRRESDDTRTLELVFDNPGNTPAWRPGQFMMLYAFGAGEIPISISGDPARRDTIIHTVRAVGDVSRAICEAKPGSAIGVRGPFGSAWPTDRCEEHDIVLVAGGIGLAPLRPVLYTIMANRSRYTRVSLLVGARVPDILLYRGEMDGWREHGIDVRLTPRSMMPNAFKGSAMHPVLSSRWEPALQRAVSRRFGTSPTSKNICLSCMPSPSTSPVWRHQQQLLRM